MGAFGIDHRRYSLAPQSPLHEGRCYCVDPSSPKETLTAVESDPVGGLFYGYGVSPINVASIPSVQERQLRFQFVKDLADLVCLEPHAFCNGLRAQRMLRSGQLSDDEGPNPMMGRSHELKPSRGTFGF
jgi:hypothetical protein